MTLAPKGKHRSEPLWVRFVTGGAASVTAEVVTLPVDCVKLRLQLQGAQNTQYTGAFNVAYNMFKSEGVLSFWKGGTPSIFRQASYSTIRMGIYEPIRDFLSNDNKPTFLQRIAAGGTAGSIGIAICNPFEVVKIRMQADIAGTRYTGMINAFKSIFKSEGIIGGWRGLSPNISRVFVSNAVELATYDQSKLILVDKFGFSPSHISTHFTASLVAGFLTALATSPLEVVKNRLMFQKMGGVLDCISSIIRKEGVTTFYKGFFPLWMRLAPWNLVMWITYERYRMFSMKVWDR